MIHWPVQESIQTGIFELELRTTINNFSLFWMISLDSWKRIESEFKTYLRWSYKILDHCIYSWFGDQNLEKVFFKNSRKQQGFKYKDHAPAILTWFLFNLRWFLVCCVFRLLNCIFTDINIYLYSNVVFVQQAKKQNKKQQLCTPVQHGLQFSCVKTVLHSTHTTSKL